MVLSGRYNGNSSSSSSKNNNNSRSSSNKNNSSNNNNRNKTETETETTATAANTTATITTSNSDNVCNSTAPIKMWRQLEATYFLSQTVFRQRLTRLRNPALGSGSLQEHRRRDWDSIGVAASKDVLLTGVGVFPPLGGGGG